MCTHFFRLTTVSLCARGLTPQERDGAIQGSESSETPTPIFLSSTVNVGCSCDFFIFMC